MFREPEAGTARLSLETLGFSGHQASYDPLRAIGRERGRDRYSLSLELSSLVSGKEGPEVLVTSYGGPTRAGGASTVIKVP